jgi:DNA ligase (NAD+)
MNIVGLGKTLTKKFVNAGMITSATDLYALKINDLLELDNFGEKSASNLLNAIENSKKNNLERLIFAFGIRNVGQKVSLVLAQKFGNIDNLIQAKMNDLTNIDEIGPIIAESAVKYFSLPQTAEFVKKLKNFGINTVYFGNDLEKIKILNGKTFVLTGSLENFSRNNAQKMIEEYGGKITSSVSQNTDFVVFGSNPGSKLRKAQTLGVQIISETEFENLFNTTGAK